MFISSAQRRRHRAIDQFIASAQATLDNPEVARRLGDKAASLMDVAGRVFVPDFEPGEPLQIPRRQRRLGGVPVIAMLPGENIILADHFTELSPQQMASGVEYLRARPDWSNLPWLLDLKSRVSKRTSSISMGTEGAATFSLGVAGDNGRLVGRPVIALNVGNQLERVADASCGPVLVHEYTHVWQCESEPLTLPWDTAVELQRERRNELEALSVGAMCIAGLRASGRQCEDVGLQLAADSICKEVNAGRVDEWAFSEFLAMRLRAAGLTDETLVG